MAEHEIETFEKGLQLGTNQRHELKIKAHSLHVRIPVDARKTELWDDRYILIEERSGEKYQQVKTVRDDQIAGDRYVDLDYFNLKPGCVYSLLIDPGDDEAYYYFKEMPFSELFA